MVMNISKSIEQGFKSIVVEQIPKEIKDGICYVKVDSSSYSMSVIDQIILIIPHQKLS